MVVMHHHPIAYLGDVSRNAGPDSRYNSGRLVAADHSRFHRTTDVGNCSVGMKVASAHAGRLDFNHDFSVVRGRVLDFEEGDLAITEEDQSFQNPLSSISKPWIRSVNLLGV
jgi:hypothetical protein